MSKVETKESKPKKAIKAAAAPVAFEPKAHQAQPVLITTEHRGVFQGDLLSYEPATAHTPARAVIAQARNCVSWRGIKGFVDLAVSGPSRNCKITPAAPEMTLEKVTAVVKCAPAAVAAWQSEPWA